MLRGDATGRVPFSLVAVLLLVSAGLSALYTAQVTWQDATRRAHEARLAALGQVGELIHEEVEAQARQIGVRAIASGIEGVVNESRIASAFRTGFADYIAYHFPRVVRGVEVRVTDFGARIHLVTRSMVDAVPSNATHLERYGDTTLEVPDFEAPDAMVETERLADYGIAGFVNYSLALDGAVVSRSLPLAARVPVPAPLIAMKLAQATRAGLGDVSGIGRTVKAIVANVVQFRVLSGWASPAKPGTTTANVLTVDDVAFAVNLALLLEEVRLFRGYDRDAAAAMDLSRGTLPPIPDGLPPPAPMRTLDRLLEAYAANGTIDAVDLHALYTGLDAHGLSMAAVLAQTIAGIADQVALKILDYLGLMPLVDFLYELASAIGEAFDGFLRWVSGQPSKQVEYIHQYLKAVFVDTGVGTRFLGPTPTSIPERTYAVTNGSGSVSITVPAHAYLVPFPAKDLLSRDYDPFWQAYFLEFRTSLERVDGSLRGFVNDLSARVATNAVLAGLLPGSASGPVDPKDNRTFLAVLAERVDRAVDDAVAWVRSDPNAVQTLMTNLWEAVRGVLSNLVENLIATYDGLANASAVVADGSVAIAEDSYTRAIADPDFAALNSSQRAALRALIDADVTANAWAASVFQRRKQEDADRWRAAVSVADRERLRTQLLAAVLGAGGALILAQDSIDGLLAEARQAQDMASMRAVHRTQLGPFTVGDGAAARETQFVVHHFPRLLSPQPWVERASIREGDLRIEVVDPATVPLTSATPNVHYTDPGNVSHRPFTTEWRVRILGAVSLRVETADRVLLGEEGLEPVVLEDVWPMNITFSVPAYSGWNLADVAYHASNTFGEDLWRWIHGFLEEAWEALRPIMDGILDGIRQVLRFVMDLLRPLLEFAQQVVEFLTKLFVWQVELLQKVVLGLINVAGMFVDWVASLLGPAEFRIHALGADVSVASGVRPGHDLEVVAAVGPIRAGFTIVDLVDAGLPQRDGNRYDALVSWDVTLGPYAMHMGFDPLLAVNAEHVFEGRASWEGAWAMDLAGPSVSSSFVVGAAFPFEVVVPPFGTVVVTLGVEARFAQEPRTLLEEILEQSFLEALDDVGGEPDTWEGLRDFLVHFARRTLESAIEALEEAFEAALYVEVHGKAAGVAGVGLRLTFLAEGIAIRALVEWLVRNLIAFFGGGFNPLAPADYGSLLRAAAENTWVGAQGYFVIEPPKFVQVLLPIEGRLEVGASIRANVAAIGTVFGQDWGVWQVEFDAYLFASIGRLGPEAQLPFVHFGEEWRVSLLRGTMHAD